MAQRGLGPEGGSRKPRIVSWGELLWDLFPEGALLGGSAANVAYHAAKLGAESFLISAIGDDLLGRRALARMRQAGVATEGINVDRTAGTGRVRVTLENGEPRFSVEEGVAWDKVAPSKDVVAALLDADVFCFSTLAQRTPLMRTRLRSVLTKIHDRGRSAPFGGANGRRPLCLLDLNLRPPFTDPDAILEAMNFADVIKMNEAEEKWIGELGGAHDVVDWLFSRFSVRLVAVTRAERGASLYTPHLTLHECGLPTKGGDPVGAGDAFVAALAFGLGRGETLQRCLERANQRGAWVAGQLGAMPA